MFSMRSLKVTAMAGAIAASLGCFQTVSAASDTKSLFTPEQKAELETIIHQYIVAHPEVLVEASKALETQAAENQQAALEQVSSMIRADPMVPVRGKPNAKHYLIEFFDYNCGYCKVVRPYTKKFLKDNDAAIFYVELPILSPISVRASAIGLALYKVDHDKYFIYQDALMESKEKITSEDQLKAAVKKAKGDYEALSKMVSEDTSIQEAMRKNMELSQKIGLQGTPFFILNGTAIRGAIRDYSVFADIIKETEKEQAAAKSNESKDAKK